MVSVLLLFILGCGTTADVEKPVSSKPVQPTSLVGGEMITMKSLLQWGNRPYLVVDVRGTVSYEAVHIPGALPVYFERLGPLYPGLAEHPKKVPVLLIAENDVQALAGAQMLAAGGFDAYGLEGGMGAWIGASMPHERKR
jgi:rhodanese-related sulfurtransferase